jgi:hypothetical protein
LKQEDIHMSDPVADWDRYYDQQVAAAELEDQSTGAAVRTLAGYLRTYVGDDHLRHLPTDIANQVRRLFDVVIATENEYTYESPVHRAPEGYVYSEQAAQDSLPF